MPKEKEEEEEVSPKKKKAAPKKKAAKKKATDPWAGQTLTSAHVYDGLDLSINMAMSTNPSNLDSPDLPPRKFPPPSAHNYLERYQDAVVSQAGLNDDIAMEE